MGATSASSRARLLRELGQPLLRKKLGLAHEDVEDESDALPVWIPCTVEELKACAISLSVALLCISVGVLHPLATEASKTAVLTARSQEQAHHRLDWSWQGGALVHDEAQRRAMPFHAASLPIAAEVVTVVFAFFAVVRECSSVAAALQRLLAPRALLRLVPIGMVYGCGDFLQTAACNAASAPVVLVVGQSKLLMTALLAKLLIPRVSATNWVRLVIIFFGAAAGADVGAGRDAPAQRYDELYGATLAFVKAGLSSSGAVLSERFYKSDADTFMVVCFQVQLMMLLTSLALLPWTASDWNSFSVSEFFHGGPFPLCSELQMTEGTLGHGSILCLDRRGWDCMTVLTTLAIVVNGFTTGLVLKHLSAVSKSICNALSTGVFYVIFVCLGYRPFCLAQALLIGIVGISSCEYATEKAALNAEMQMKAKAKRIEEP